MAIELGDDGTMDTVIVCTDCGREYRFNYDGGPFDINGGTSALMDANPGMSVERARELLDETLYDEWVEGCILEVEAEHVCGSDDE